MITYCFDAKILGENIKALREKNDMTLWGVEHKLKEMGVKCSRQTLSKAEYGETVLSLEVLCGICNLMNCTLDYLLGVDPYKSKEIDDVRKATGLSSSAVEKLLSFEFRKRNSSFLNSLITYKSLGLLSIEFEKYLIQKAAYKNRRTAFQKAKEVENASQKELIDRLPTLFDDEFELDEKKPDKSEWIRQETERITSYSLSRSEFYKYELEKLRQIEFAFIAEISHFLDNVEDENGKEES